MRISVCVCARFCAIELCLLWTFFSPLLCFLIRRNLIFTFRQHERLWLVLLFICYVNFCFHHRDFETTFGITYYFLTPLKNKKSNFGNVIRTYSNFYIVKFCLFFRIAAIQTITSAKARNELRQHEQSIINIALLLLYLYYTTILKFCQEVELTLDCSCCRYLNHYFVEVKIENRQHE